jgi:hypothetical protein
VLRIPERAVDYKAFADRHLVAKKINTKSKKTPAYTVEGITTPRIKFTFEESNFELLCDMGAKSRKGKVIPLQA